MTPDTFRIFGIALIGMFASLLLKERYRGIGILSSALTVIMICMSVIQGPWKDLVSAIGSFADAAGFSKYALILLKAVGIGYMTVITEGLCTEAGENSLAFAVNLAGRAQIILLSLPLISSMMEIAKGLL